MLTIRQTVDKLAAAMICERFPAHVMPRRHPAATRDMNTRLAHFAALRRRARLRLRAPLALRSAGRARQRPPDRTPARRRHRKKSRGVINGRSSAKVDTAPRRSRSRSATCASPSRWRTSAANTSRSISRTGKRTISSSSIRSAARCGAGRRGRIFTQGVQNKQLGERRDRCSAREVVEARDARPLHSDRDAAQRELSPSSSAPTSSSINKL